MARPLPPHGHQLLGADGPAAQGGDPVDQGPHDLEPVRPLLEGHGEWIRTQERGLHLYDEVAFVADPLPDGGIADTNYLWLSDWYLANLNALFTAPLDYELWRQLDERSPIASRLYEFLLLNFYSGAPVLRINYEKLAQFLPVQPERYASDARRQLDPAFGLLTAAGVIEAAEWADSKDGLAQLHFHRGRSSTAAGDQDPVPAGSRGGGVRRGGRGRGVAQPQAPGVDSSSPTSTASGPGRRTSARRRRSWSRPAS